MTPLVLCTLTIIITLVASGIAKAKDRASTAAAIVNLKLDRWLPLKFVSRVLPWGEIALAFWLLLVPGWPAILGGIAAVILFAAYWIVIARAVATGNTASCNCFGGASEAPVSRFTLIRNTALLGAAIGALVAAVQTRTSALVTLLHLDGAGWLWILGAVFAAAALWAMYRSELLATPAVEAAHEVAPQMMQPAPVEGEANEDDEYVRLPIPYGTLETNLGTRSLRELAEQRARVLFFLSPGCGPCLEIIPKIADWQKHLPMLSLHPVVSSKEQIAQLHMPEEIEVWVDPGFNTQIAFGRGTPMVIALGIDGLLAGGPVFGSHLVTDFMDDLLYEFDAA